MRVFACSVVVALVGCSEPEVAFKALTDGTVEVEGARFSEVVALKLKLAEVQKRQPRPRIQLDAEGTSGGRWQPSPDLLQRLKPALDLLRDAGFFDGITVGFVTEPKPIQ
jgi:hypothetical protein